MFLGTAHVWHISHSVVELRLSTNDTQNSTILRYITMNVNSLCACVRWQCQCRRDVDCQWRDATDAATPRRPASWLVDSTYSEQPMSWCLLSPYDPTDHTHNYHISTGQCTLYGYGQYLAKLQTRTWLSRALSSSFGSVLARCASETTTLLLVTLTNIHQFKKNSLTRSTINLF